MPEAEGPPRSSLPERVHNETNSKDWNHANSIKASLRAVALADDTDNDKSAKSVSNIKVQNEGNSKGGKNVNLTTASPDVVALADDTDDDKSAKSVSNIKVQNEGNSRGGKNVNLTTASPDAVDRIGDMQDVNSYTEAVTTEICLLTLCRKVKVQRTPIMNSSKAANRHFKNHTVDAPIIIDLVTHEEEFVKPEEMQAPSTAAAPVIIDLLSYHDLLMEGQALILIQTNNLARANAAATEVLTRVVVEDKHATWNLIFPKRRMRRIHTVAK
jgi:hypothetical protein